MNATVQKVSRDYAWVKLDAAEGQGRLVLARPRGRLELVSQHSERLARQQRVWEAITAQQLVIGDRVRVSQPEQSDDETLWTIEEVATRQTWLLRKSEGRYSRKPQLIIANADQLAVVVAPNPTIRISTIDRYFLAAMQGGLEPLLIVNKTDLDPQLQSHPDIASYRKLGYRVCFTCARDGSGLEALPQLLADKLTVFCGHSGVGKSTLLAALTGEEIRTGEVRARDLKGRQTTVTAAAYALPGGGFVVDTPGIREFGLAHLSWLDVNEYFHDIAALALGCSYADCSHSVEPGCAVQAAAAAGELSAQRLRSYQRLRSETEQT